MFSSNRAPLGPAVSNTAEVTITSAAFRNNTLLCDDVDGSMFLDWQTVSSENLDQMSEGDLLAPHVHGESRSASAGGWLRRCWPMVWRQGGLPVRDNPRR